MPASGQYPLSGWTWRPLAGRLAARLVHTPLRPWHLSLCNLAAGLAAAGIVAGLPEFAPAAAMLVLLAWFFDRADGQLARLQETATSFGAWLDGNLDELLDLTIQAAIASAATAAGSAWAWPLFVAFVFGKYLLMHGLLTDESAIAGHGPQHIATYSNDANGGIDRDAYRTTGLMRRWHMADWLKAAYHLPGNADIRVHFTVLCLVGGWLTTELALVAAYYNVRWLARYLLMARKSWSAAR